MGTRVFISNEVLRVFLLTNADADELIYLRPSRVVVLDSLVSRSDGLYLKTCKVEQLAWGAARWAWNVGHTPK